MAPIKMRPHNSKSGRALRSRREKPPKLDIKKVEQKCPTCKKKFPTLASVNRHSRWCKTPKARSVKDKKLQLSASLGTQEVVIKRKVGRPRKRKAEEYIEEQNVEDDDDDNRDEEGEEVEIVEHTIGSQIHGGEIVYLDRQEESDVEVELVEDEISNENQIHINDYQEEVEIDSSNYCEPSTSLNNCNRVSNREKREIEKYKLANLTQDQPITCPDCNLTYRTIISYKNHLLQCSSYTSTSSDTDFDNNSDDICNGEEGKENEQHKREILRKKLSNEFYINSYEETIKSDDNNVNKSPEKIESPVIDNSKKDQHQEQQPLNFNLGSDISLLPISKLKTSPINNILFKLDHSIPKSQEYSMQNNSISIVPISSNVSTLPSHVEPSTISSNLNTQDKNVNENVKRNLVTNTTSLSSIENLSRQTPITTTNNTNLQIINLPNSQQVPIQDHLHNFSTIQDSNNSTFTDSSYENNNNKRNEQIADASQLNQIAQNNYQQQILAYLQRQQQKHHASPSNLTSTTISTSSLPSSILSSTTQLPNSQRQQQMQLLQQNNIAESSSIIPYQPSQQQTHQAQLNQIYDNTQGFQKTHHHIRQEEAKTIVKVHVPQKEIQQNMPQTQILTVQDSNGQIFQIQIPIQQQQQQQLPQYSPEQQQQRLIQQHQTLNIPQMCSPLNNNQMQQQLVTNTWNPSIQYHSGQPSTEEGNNLNKSQTFTLLQPPSIMTLQQRQQFIDQQIAFYQLQQNQQQILAAERQQQQHHQKLINHQIFLQQAQASQQHSSINSQVITTDQIPLNQLQHNIENTSTDAVHYILVQQSNGQIATIPIHSSQTPQQLQQLQQQQQSHNDGRISAALSPANIATNNANFLDQNKSFSSYTNTVQQQQQQQSKSRSRQLNTAINTNIATNNVNIVNSQGQDQNNTASTNQNFSQESHTKAHQHHMTNGTKSYPCPCESCAQEKYIPLIPQMAATPFGIEKVRMISSLPTQHQQQQLNNQVPTTIVNNISPSWTENSSLNIGRGLTKRLPIPTPTKFIKSQLASILMEKQPVKSLTKQTNGSTTFQKILPAPSTSSSLNLNFQTTKTTNINMNTKIIHSSTLTSTPITTTINENNSQQQVEPNTIVIIDSSSLNKMPISSPNIAVVRPMEHPLQKMSDQISQIENIFNNSAAIGISPNHQIISAIDETGLFTTNIIGGINNITNNDANNLPHEIFNATNNNILVPENISNNPPIVKELTTSNQDDTIISQVKDQMIEQSQLEQRQQLENSNQQELQVPGLQQQQKNNIKVTLKRREGGNSYSIKNISETGENNGAMRSLKIKAKITSGEHAGKMTDMVVEPSHSINPVNNNEELDPNNAKVTHEIAFFYEVKSDGTILFRSNDVRAVWCHIFETVQGTKISKYLAPLIYPETKISIPQFCKNPAEFTNILLKRIGFPHCAIKFLLEQLQDVKESLTFEKAKNNTNNVQQFEGKPTDPEECISNCARTEGFKGRRVFDMFGWLGSDHRELIINSQQYNEDLHLQGLRILSLNDKSEKNLRVYRSTVHGRGLFTKKDIKIGEMVIEYSGEIIRSIVCDMREKLYISKGIDCYFFRIDDSQVIDATMKGNAARFINHSCEPNCESKCLNILGKKRIVIIALRKISKGEELSYDYKFSEEDLHNKVKCTCGAKKCRKYLN